MSTARELSKKLYYIQKPNRWTSGIGAALPESYKKFWKEWKLTTPSPVHYIPEEGRFKKREDGTIVPIQNNPIPLKYPKEFHEGIWGGEAVVMGFYKKHFYKRRFRKYWVPQLKKSVVYSEVLNKYMRMTVTDRTLELVHKHYGFDHYLLSTKACDLMSELALKLKREILISLADKTLYPDDPVKRDEVYEKYKKYLEPYSREDIEWYGLSWKNATGKFIKMQLAAYNPQPLKIQFRAELIKQLQDEQLESGSEESQSSWLSKINPFGSKSSSSLQA
ncbi:large ribosomal subunit protein bL28m [Phymastichus coffea]|uniref:large ribosomal subunit protein bL28m n=1 Tax=Phymastichus coffea TaxID=108790 RepID=UPI00273B66A8|nr:large ribosomal subunit protein bL28m [Phymastichus coffea]